MAVARWFRSRPQDGFAYPNLTPEVAPPGGFVVAWAVDDDDDLWSDMKKNVAGQVVGCGLVSASDGSAFTGSVTISVTGDGGAQATGSVGSGACTHEGLGYHTYAPAQAETNYDVIGFTFTGTGAIPKTRELRTTFPQTGDGFARLGAPAGASISADVAAVKVDTAAILVDTGTTLDARIPAALVGGRMDSSVGAMAANVLTAAAINADAITDAKVAADVTIASVTGAVGSVTGAVGSVTGAVGSVTGAVGSVTGAVGSVTGNVGGNVVGSVASVTAAVTVGAINAAGVQDLFTVNSGESAATAVAGSVVAETGDAAANATVGSTEFLDVLAATTIDGVPVAVGGIAAAAFAANAIDASALAASAVDEILDDTIGDGTITVRQSLRVTMAASAGKLSGAATTTATIRNLADTADVIVATVDVDGNRTAVTVTP